MFKNYYEILGIQEDATSEQIKAAFRIQAKQWHPDKNRGVNTTVQMQNINEAYLILNDPEAKEHYDKEYHRYKQVIINEPVKNKYSQTGYTDYSEEFTIEDETLKYWIENARKQAILLVQKMMREMVDLSKDGVKAAGSEIWRLTKIYLAAGIVFSIIISILRGCDY